MRILFVHPEGNLANNPNLSAVVELLASSGHEIVVRCPHGNFAQHEHPNVRVLGVSRRVQGKLFELSGHPQKWLLGKLLLTLLPPTTPPTDIIIGVDRQGLIEGAAIARLKNVPLACWSYEIFFSAECFPRLKAQERREVVFVRLAGAQKDLPAPLLPEETVFPNK